MADFSKSERKKLRELAGIAYERYLTNALSELRSHFDAMDRGDISPFDLSQRIHEFHQGPSRDLYVMFSHSLPWLAVCRAYIEGIINDEDLVDASEPIRNELLGFKEHVTNTR